MLVRQGFVSVLATAALLIPASTAFAETGSPPLRLATTSSMAQVTTQADAVTNLPHMQIELADGNTLEWLNETKDHKTAATLDLVDPANPGFDLADAVITEIKGRGNSTWNRPKKPYQIKFDSAVGVLGMETHKTWVLLANHLDPSLMRNKLTYDLADSFGLEYSPQSRFVDLTVNDTYLGTYLLSEKTEVGTHRVELQTDEGVLLELDNNYGTEEDHYFYGGTSRSVFVLNDATIDVDDFDTEPVLQKAYSDVQAYINKLETLLYAPDPDWNAISQMIDVDSFIKYYFIFETSANPDVNRSSMFFYKDGPGDVLHAGPVWDFDLAMGQFRVPEKAADPTGEWARVSDILGNKRSSWFEQLARNEQFVQRAYDVYSAELQSHVEALPANIDALEGHLSQSAAENFEVWDVLGEVSTLGSTGHVISDTYEGEVAYLRNWVDQRVHHLGRSYDQAMPVLRFASYVSTIGWQRAVTSGMVAGTTGQALRLEAVRLALYDNGLSGTVQGNAHVQSIGWMGYRSPGSAIGTTGRSLRLEAIQLRLTGELAAKYDLEYRVNVQGLGWMRWVQNGAAAGTVGKALRVEAIQIRLLEKTQALPSAVYSSHVQSLGWLPPVHDGAISGTTGRSLRLEALQLNVNGSKYSGDVQYRGHVQGIGWMSWTTSQFFIGTLGQSRRLEAFEIKLTGDLATRFSVRYSAYVQGIGWQPYVANGQTAGTTGQGRRVEAVRISLVARTS